MTPPLKHLIWDLRFVTHDLTPLILRLHWGILDPYSDFVPGGSLLAGTGSFAVRYCFKRKQVCSGSFLHSFMEAPSLCYLCFPCLQGELVEDEVILQILGDAMQQPDCEKGFILDGFPRSVAQAEKICVANACMV